MWLWNETPSAHALIENRDGAQDELLAFLTAPHGVAAHQINRLFFAARALAGSEPFERPFTVAFDPLLDEATRPQLQRFLSRLSAAGVATEYLAGQAIWLASDAFAQTPRQICRDVVQYNRLTPQPGARFAGIHLDIEPHTVTRGPYARQWWQNRLPQGYNADWTQRWQQILTDCRATLDEYEAETGHAMTLTSDVGTDFSHYNQPMHAFLNRPDGPLDYISVLNYFDTHDNADGEPAFFFGERTDRRAVGGVRQNLKNWTQLPVLFGLETGPESIAPDEASFHQEGWEAMYRVIDQLHRDYGAARTIGVGVHHYGPDAYRDMKRSPISEH